MLAIISWPPDLKLMDTIAPVNKFCKRENENFEKRNLYGNSRRQIRRLLQWNLGLDGKGLVRCQTTVKIYADNVASWSAGHIGNIQFTVVFAPHVTPTVGFDAAADWIALCVPHQIQNIHFSAVRTVGCVKLYQERGPLLYSKGCGEVGVLYILVRPVGS